MTAHRIASIALAGLTSFASITPAQAEGPLDHVVSAEILPGWDTEDGTHMAGLRLQLAEGWKTYWRAPGAAGLPPRFDWSGSDNIQDVAVHWPRPEVFYQNDMRAIGYRDEVVLPIEVTPAKPGQPVSMRAEVDLGVCEDVCLPVSLLVRAELPAKADAEPIRAALDLRPDSAASAGVGAVTCHAEPIDDGMRLTATIPVRPLGDNELVAVETADPSIWVADASTTRQGDHLTTITDLVPEAATPFEIDPSGMRFTVLAGAQAIEISGCALN